MSNKDNRSSLAYAIGQAIEHEPDPQVKAELEKLENEIIEADQIIIVHKGESYTEA